MRKKKKKKKSWRNVWMNKDKELTLQKKNER